MWVMLHFFPFPVQLEHGPSHYSAHLVGRSNFIMAVSFNVPCEGPIWFLTIHSWHIWLQSCVFLKEAGGAALPPHWCHHKVPLGAAGYSPLGSYPIVGAAGKQGTGYLCLWCPHTLVFSVLEDTPQIALLSCFSIPSVTQKILYVDFSKILYRHLGQNKSVLTTDILPILWSNCVDPMQGNLCIGSVFSSAAESYAQGAGLQRDWLCVFIHFHSFTNSETFK